MTFVVSCCPAELHQEVNGKKETFKGFNIKLQDTILFPEGGGQVSMFLIQHVSPESTSHKCTVFSLLPRSRMTTVWLEMFQFWGWQDKDRMLYTL